MFDRLGKDGAVLIPPSGESDAYLVCPHCSDTGWTKAPTIVRASQEYERVEPCRRCARGAEAYLVMKRMLADQRRPRKGAASHPEVNRRIDDAIAYNIEIRAIERKRQQASPENDDDLPF